MLKDRLPSLTIFMGSFLIFGVQPMLGRTLLPAFGGTAAVWTTCLATYQVLLLAGYWYAHCVSVEGRREEVGGRREKVAGRREEVGGRREEVEGRREKVGGRREEVGGRRWKTGHILLLGVAVAWVAGFAYGPCTP